MQSAGGEGGLPEWTADDKIVENEDIVVYHSFGVAHVPRPEDFPVMPCESTGKRMHIRPMHRSKFTPIYISNPKMIFFCCLVLQKGFMLKPDSFFSGNPGIDLPPDKSSMSKCNQCK